MGSKGRGENNGKGGEEKGPKKRREIIGLFFQVVSVMCLMRRVVVDVAKVNTDLFAQGTSSQL